jgi:hypothetical protein
MSPGVLDWDIAVSVTPAVPPFHSSSAFNSFFADSFPAPEVPMRFAFFGNQVLDLGLDAPLTDAGGLVAVHQGPNYGHISIFGPRYSADFTILSGTLIGTPIPEPSGGSVLALGLAALVATHSLRKPSKPYRLQLMQTRWKGGSEWQRR